MDNKKYLDKVIGSLVRSTDIDYEKEQIYYPFVTSSVFTTPYITFKHLPYRTSPFAFSDYCENTFGLTEDEIKYVWEIYKDIIKDKIDNGQ